MATRNTTQLVYIPDHRDRMLASLLSQWRGKPRIEALIRALSVGVQFLEDMTFDLLVSRTIEGASGAQLDQWGQLVGQARLNMEDAEYKSVIRVKIIANSSEGTTDDLIQVLQLACEPCTVKHHECFPAGAVYWVYR